MRGERRHVAETFLKRKRGLKCSCSSLLEGNTSTTRHLDRCTYFYSAFNERLNKTNGRAIIRPLRCPYSKPSSSPSSFTAYHSLPLQRRLPLSHSVMSSLINSLRAGGKQNQIEHKATRVDQNERTAASHTLLFLYYFHLSHFLSIPSGGSSILPTQRQK